MTDEPLFDFAVPDDLLREVVAKTRDPEAVAGVEMMPGTGEGKPPSLVSILRTAKFAPLVLLTAAAMVPGTLGYGIKYTDDFTHTHLGHLHGNPHARTPPTQHQQRQTPPPPDRSRLEPNKQARPTLVV